MRKQKIKEKNLTINELVLLILNSISISDVSSFYSQYKGRMRRNHLTYIYLSIMERALEGLARVKPNGTLPFIVEKDDKKIGVIAIDSSYVINKNKIKKIDDIHKFSNDNNLSNVFLVFIKKSDIDKDVIISNYIRKNKYNKINLIVFNQYKS